jgi:hypothetical protein
MTILSEMLMLVPRLKLRSVGLIKPNQTKSNRIKPAGRQKSSKFRVQDLKFNAPNTKIGGEGKTKMTTPSVKVHLCDGDYVYDLDHGGRNSFPVL